jgi:hypothetical protein
MRKGEERPVQDAVRIEHDQARLAGIGSRHGGIIGGSPSSECRGKAGM